MTQFEDQRGLPVTAASADAVRAYDRVIDGYLRFDKDTGNYLKATLAADPELALAHCTRGYFFKLFADRKFDPRIAQAIDATQASLEARGGTAREKRHLAALRAWHAGHLIGATATWEAILLDDPRDVLALRLAHFTHFYMGDSRNLRDSVARVLPGWDDGVPGRGFVLGMHAFGLEETGDYRRAEATGRHAVEINPGDIWGTHAVAHVMEMEGRHREGIGWIDGLIGGWQNRNNFVGHVWWHRALFNLELGQHDAVLDLYDARVRADLKSDEYLDIVNAASLLWRLEEEGIDVGARWTELADKAEARAGDRLYVFVDAHFVMALAAGGRADAARAMIGSMSDIEGVTEAPLYAAIGVPLCEALIAFRAGQWDRAVELCLPIRYDIQRIGGSHAQRDVFARMLIEATIRAGRFGLARALLAERTALLPNSRWSWQSMSRALDGLGDGAAAAAREKARTLCVA